MIKYQDYEKLIYKTAWNWSNKTEIEFDEFVSLSNLVFTESIKKYNPEKYTFGTFFKKCLHNAFFVYVKKQNTKKAKREYATEPNQLDRSIALSTNPEKHCIFVDGLKSLSEDAKMVINIVMDAPADLLAIMPHGRVSKIWIKKYLRKLGWKIIIIDDCFDEIKSAINI